MNVYLSIAPSILTSNTQPHNPLSFHIFLSSLTHSLKPECILCHSLIIHYFIQHPKTCDSETEPQLEKIKPDRGSRSPPFSIHQLPWYTIACALTGERRR